jgi:hypothetical protein
MGMNRGVYIAIMGITSGVYTAIFTDMNRVVHVGIIMGMTRAIYIAVIGHDRVGSI